MPIPGDNGNSEKEKMDQDKRINNVCNTGACVQKEVIFNKPEPNEVSIFGKI